MLRSVENQSEIQRPGEERKNLLTDDEKWNAVLSRDGYSDGDFVFAVRSTRIYCKPSCPAKRPARKQVQFFSSGAEAERSGFRPCRRCRPNEAIRSPQHASIDRVRAYIQNNLDKKLTLSILSAQVGISPYHLQRTFKRVVGISPRRYVEALRLAKMKCSLINGETVTRALYSAGFSSRSRFYEKGSFRFGMSPGVVRRGGRGIRISYTIVNSSLGRLLVGATRLGICAVCIGDSDAAVENALSEEYPSASLLRDDQALHAFVTPIKNYFVGRQFDLKLPIDVQASAFQLRVWKEIQSIPYGYTSTYSQIARDLGEPQAARAVARACATNPVALVVPCHRVIGKNGELRGYRWGKKRKQELLALEQTRQS